MVIFGLVTGCGDRAIVGPDPDKNLPAPVWPADAGAADGDKVDG